MTNPAGAPFPHTQTASAPAIRVLIVDDHAMVRGGLRRIIESEPGLRVSGQAVDGNSTLDRLCDTPCDVLILDITMPAPNGSVTDENTTGTCGATPCAEFTA